MAAMHHPPHGGYPTPRYEDAPVRQRAESHRLFGHPGAHVGIIAEDVMARAGDGISHERLVDGIRAKRASCPN